ncbi:hypothetical protein ABIB80_007277 [Bradyrhizobium sp. i1.15.2]
MASSKLADALFTSWRPTDPRAAVNACCKRASCELSSGLDAPFAGLVVPDDRPSSCARGAPSFSCVPGMCELFLSPRAARRLVSTCTAALDGMRIAFSYLNFDHADEANLHIVIVPAVAFDNLTRLGECNKSMEIRLLGCSVSAIVSEQCPGGHSGQMTCEGKPCFPGSDRSRALFLHKVELQRADSQHRDRRSQRAETEALE